MQAQSAGAEGFDAAYYRRFYLDPATRAVSPAEARRQAEFIAAYLRYLRVPIRRILDIGCGLGRSLRALQRAFPRARCRGVELSSYPCRKYGWEQGSVVDYRSATPFDLVVCNDVLPYLDDPECARAIANLARLSRNAVFLGILTREDWERCDQERTDPEIRLRPTGWYRRRLSRHFVNAGGGLYLKKPPAVTLWSLEQPV